MPDRMTPTPDPAAPAVEVVEAMDSDHPIHAWFSLTRSSYFVLPRLAMDAMPVEWQRRFVALMNDAEAAGVETPGYHVFRKGEEYTRVERYDEDDDGSQIVGVSVVQEDPWADYRRGCFEEVNGKPLAANPHHASALLGDGWVAVPRGPTPAMLLHGSSRAIDFDPDEDGCMSDEALQAVWSAMLAATPERAP